MHTFAQKPKVTQQTGSTKPTIPSRSHFGQNREVNSILHLQRTIGNQAVLRLLQAQTEDVEVGQASNESTGFVHDFSRIQVDAGTTPPGDIYEQQADPVSDGVMLTTAPATQKASATEERKARRIPNTQSSALGAGESLSQSERSGFESRLGHSFGGVRVHTDRAAASSAVALGAAAFTVGQHIYFAPGRFALGTDAGDRLLSHELAHTVQQRGAAPVDPADLEIAPADSAAEQAAHAGAEHALAPVPLTEPTLARQAIQRAEAGTYVSRGGDQTFLNAAFNFYRNWGHPNVRRVDNLEQVVGDLSRRGRGNLDTYRIVSHANLGGLLLGFSSTISPAFLDRGALALREGSSFRSRVAVRRLISDAEFTTIFGHLLADAAIEPHLRRLGVGAGPPATNSSLGILLRALLEEQFVADPAQPAIANRPIIDAFNAQRIRDFGRAVVSSMTGRQAQQNARAAITALRRGIAQALHRANYSFPVLTAAEAAALAGRFSNPTGNRLNPAISTEISEGSGQGSFLRNVERVRARTTIATHVEIRGCQIGQNPIWLDDFRAFMGNTGAQPSISAPDLFQYYFPLNFQTRTTRPADEAALDADIADPATGIERDFQLQTQVRRGDLIQVSISESGADFIRRYGLAARNISLASLQRLNPEIANWTALPLGTTVFLRARQVPAGTATGWEDIAARHFRSRHRWPTVWGFNPHINRTNLRPNDQIFLQSDADRQQFGLMPAAPTRTDIKTAIRSGQAVPAIESTPAGDQPRLHLDNAQRAAAIGRWLATQRFDPQGRTARALSRLFAGRNFTTAATRLHMNFLSRSFPNIEDPIFPDDPRFTAHIIRRP